MSIRFSHQSLERAKFRDTCPSLNVIQTGVENGRSPNAPPYDRKGLQTGVRSEKSLQGIQQACKLHKELFKIKEHHGDVRSTVFFGSFVPTKAKNTVNGWAIHTKERMYIADGGASLHMMG